MGQRANLALVTADPGYELYYTHWRANSLDRDLFWGPEAALTFARAQRSRAEGAAWLDEVWAEGGALIDTVRRELLWFGGEDVRYDVPLRRVYLRLMQSMWSGWAVQWADEGVADLVRRLGLPVSTVLVSGSTLEIPDGGLGPPAEPEWISGAISVRRGSGALSLHGLDASFAELAWMGPRLLDALGPAPVAELDLSSGSFPHGGVHADEACHEVEVWLGPGAADLERRLAAAWPGWRVTWHRDRFEAQLERCEGRLRFGERRLDELVDHVRRLVTRAPIDRRDVIPSSIERIAPGAQVSVNAFALRDDPPPATTIAELARFERAARDLSA